MAFMDDIEEQAQSGAFRKSGKSNALSMLISKLSAGRNPEKLARILVAWNTTITVLGWQDKPIANLTDFLTHYQASVDGGYHKDLKDVLIAEEVVKRQENRKGISILQQ